MKNSARILFSMLFVLFLTALIFAQDIEIKWSFPKSGMKTTEVNGKTVYELSPTVTGIESSIGGSPLMIINIPADVATKADAAHAENPAGMPDVNKYIASLGVSYAVETPEGHTNESTGSREIDGLTYYFFSTSTGASVAATVSDDRTFVFVTPAPPGQ